jgi:toxin ParE1/3/4
MTEWGESVADRYETLLFAAFAVISANPEHPGSRAIPGARGVRAYPIRLSRRSVPPSRRIGKPRHIVIYRVAMDGVLEILGIIHDRMLIEPASRRLIRDAEF